MKNDIDIKFSHHIPLPMYSVYHKSVEYTRQSCKF